jgi:hypothetical protein
MPIVFVHGVNNRREDPDYEPRRKVTEQFLRKCFQGAVINGKTFAAVNPYFPYWGDLGAKFAWNMQSLPSGEMDALGPGVEASLRPLVAAVRDLVESPGKASDQPLLAVAQQSFPRAVDILVELLLLSPGAATADQVAEFILALQHYAAAFEPPMPPPAWLANIQTDEQFHGRLIAEAQNVLAASPQALGGFGAVGNALAAGAARLKQATKAVAGKILDKVGDLASTKVLAWSRGSLNATIGRFFGDVFMYLNGRGDQAAPGEIPSRILAAVDQAIAAAPANEPLVIMAHSLGGVISFDLLTHFRPALKVDLFITVGSQVPHFEEMKLYRESQPGIPSVATPRAPKPANLKHWINVFDEVDIFSYSCKKIFADVQDFAYDTQTYVIKAHGAYFEQPRFYDRIRSRVDGLPTV